MDNTLLPELKSCPFCGNIDIELNFMASGHYRIGCRKCNVNTGGYFTKETAIKAWNRRVQHER